jgi:glycosyltransferase involved in cell wall biosynthesis
MRVVWLSHNSDIGGAELCLAEAVQALKAHGVESTVLLPWSGQLEEHLGGLEIPVEVQLYRWWVGRDADRAMDLRVRRALRNLTTLPALIRRLRELRPDVIVSNTLTIPSGAVAARILGVPHLWHILEFGAPDMGLPFDWGERVSGWVIRNLSTRAAVCSHALRDKVAEWMPAEKVHVVYNGVRMPRGEAPPLPGDGPLRLVNFGAKHWGKRQEDAVRAIALLARDGVECHLTLLGREDARYGAYLEKLVGELEVGDRVEIKKFVADPYAEVARAHAFVMPSRCEAFGRVTIEAMKLGRPVIGANRAATAELVRDGWNGLHFEGENPQDLAEKLRIINDDRVRLAEMARNAYEWSTQTFTMERFAHELYDALLETYESGSTPGR